MFPGSNRPRSSLAGLFGTCSVEVSGMILKKDDVLQCINDGGEHIDYLRLNRASQLLSYVLDAHTYDRPAAGWLCNVKQAQKHISLALLEMGKI